MIPFCKKRCGARWLRGVIIALGLLICLAGTSHANDETKAAHAQYEKAMKQKDAAMRFKLLLASTARYPHSAELRYALGREYHQRAQIDSALIHFEQVLQLDAALARKTDLVNFVPQAYSAWAQQALKLGKLSEAEQAAQNALRYDEENPAALNVVAVTAYQRKDYTQAIAFGVRLLALQPSARNHNNLGAAYEARGELVSAEQHYQQAVVLDPNLAEAQQNLQRVHVRTNALIAEAAQKELPSKPVAKNNSRSITRTEAQSRKDKPAKAESTLQASPVSPKAKGKSIPAPEAKPQSRAALPAAEHSPQPLNAATKAPAPIAWNTTQAPQHGNWGKLLWLGGALIAIIILWRGVKIKKSTYTLQRLKRFWSTHETKTQRSAAPRTALALTHLNAEHVRMLRRIEEEPQRLLPAPANARRDFSATTPLLAPERARLALPAPAPVTRPEQVGMQTEMLFAEMIAAAPEAFEHTHIVAATNTREAHSSSKPNGSTTPRIEVALPTSEASHVAPAPFALSTSLAKTVQHAAAPRTQENPTPKVVLLQELQAVASSPEIETPQFVARATNLVMEQTPATPAPTALGETQTMLLPALAVQRIGRYVIERELAQGTTGKIFKAWDPKLDRMVVLKTVQYGLSTSATEVAALKDRIYREARAIAKFNHPNIVIVYDVDDQPEFSYLVMEYLEGRDLKQVLEREHRLEYQRALTITLQICQAMEYAHRAGVFHRDVKPSNIMLLDNDEVKVMDFGIAKISNYLSLTQTGRVLGTPSYMAPEQIEGQATDGRADLFSLGVVLYELLVGKRPFVADSLAALAYKIVHKNHMPPSLENVELPLALDEVLNRVLAKRPEERFQNAAEFGAALMQVRKQNE